MVIICVWQLRTNAVQDGHPMGGRFIQTNGMAKSPACVKLNTYRIGTVYMRLHIMAKVANKSIDLAGGSVGFTFSNGTEISISLSDLNKETLEHVALHGLSQKVGDSYASAESIEEAVASAEAVIKNLVAGVWATKSVKGGKVVEALVAVYKKPYAECLAAFAKLDDKGKAALRKHSSIKLELARIEARRAEALAEAAKGQPSIQELGLF